MAMENATARTSAAALSRRSFLGLAGFAVVSLATAGLGLSAGATGALADDGTIKLGTISTNTGTAAAYGEGNMQGYQLAVKEINANGGILGKQVELDSLDDKGDATEASNAFNKLQGDSSVCAILGPTISATSAAVQPLADQDKMVCLLPVATADSIQTGSYVFRACFKDSYQGQVAAQFAKNTLGATKAAVLYSSGDAYSSGLHDAFVAEAQKLGLEVVSEQASSSMDDTEYSSQLGMIIASGADFLYAPYYFTSAGPYIIPQARQNGFTGPIMGGDGFDGIQNVMSGDPSQYNDVYYTNHFAPDDPSEAVQNYTKAFKAEYGDDQQPNFLNTLAYDAVYMMKAAIEKAGSADREAIHAAMTGMTFTGVSGTFTLDASGSPIKDAVVLEYKDGQPAYNSTVKAAGSASDGEAAGSAAGDSAKADK